MQSFQTRSLLASHDKSRTGSQPHGSEKMCIDKDCETLMKMFNCSAPLQSEPCEPTSEDLTIPLVLWVFTLVIILLLCTHLLLVCKGKGGFLDNIFGKLVFTMGIFITLVTQFCTIPYLQVKGDNVTVGFNIAVNGLAISVVYLGYRYLFEQPKKGEYNQNGCMMIFQKTKRFLFGWPTDDNIGSHDQGMGLVIFVIALALLLLESVLLGFLFYYQHESEIVGLPFCFFLLSFLVEKAVQTFFYIRIRKRKPRDGYEKGAAFYFNFLAFLNFTWWLNNISFAEIRIYKDVARIPNFRYFDDTFKALLIDFRLLCALLFLEHSDIISHKNKKSQQVVTFDNIKKKKAVCLEQSKTLKNRCSFIVLGFFIGVICLVLEVAVISQLVFHEDIFGFYICPIAADVVLVILACFLLKRCKVKEKRMFEKVEYMVMSMGAASIVYLWSFCLTCWISFRHEEPVEYVKWYGSVLFFRGISLLVLLLVYASVPVGTMSHNRWENYVLVSALFLGLFARFVGSVIDEQLGRMHDIVHHHITSKKLRYLLDLFALGPLFQLATCLHLSLHFLLMLLRLCKVPEVENNETYINAAVPEQGDANGEDDDGRKLIILRLSAKETT